VGGCLGRASWRKLQPDNGFPPDLSADLASQSVCACQLTRSNFDRWRRILARDPSASSREASSSSPSSTFIPVRVVAEPVVEVVMLSGIVVRLPLSAAPETVTRLVAV
jgi:hypothetical protein